MEPHKVYAADFTLNSKYTCATSVEYKYNDSKDELLSSQTINFIRVFPTTAKHTVTFDLSSIPQDAIISSAMVFATAGSPAYGCEISTINGINVGTSGEKTVPVTIEAGAASISIEFAYKCKAVTHDHYWDGYESANYWDGTTKVEIYNKDHESVVAYTGVYLLIEFADSYTPPTLIAYTDPYPVAGETYVKAVHMTELHENVNRLRIAKGLAAYAFTAITSMQTSLAGWNAHVLEIRAALDEVSADHDAWLVLDVNRPRLDVLMQLRSMVEALAA